jgi:hypothetical protein
MNVLLATQAFLWLDSAQAKVKAATAGHVAGNFETLGPARLRCFRQSGLNGKLRDAGTAEGLRVGAGVGVFLPANHKLALI